MKAIILAGVSTLKQEKAGEEKRIIF